HHSANYRSVVAYGTGRLVTDNADKRAVLSALVDKLGAGRAADSRPPTDRELDQTALLRLELHEVSYKARAGGVADDPADLGLPPGAGVIPLRLPPGRRVPDGDAAGPPPAYLPAL